MQQTGIAYASYHVEAQRLRFIERLTTILSALRPPAAFSLHLDERRLTFILGEQIATWEMAGLERCGALSDDEDLWFCGEISPWMWRCGTVVARLSPWTNYVRAEPFSSVEGDKDAEAMRVMRIGVDKVKVALRDLPPGPAQELIEKMCAGAWDDGRRDGAFYVGYWPSLVRQIELSALRSAAPLLRQESAQSPQDDRRFFDFVREMMGRALTTWRSRMTRRQRPGGLHMLCTVEEMGTARLAGFISVDDQENADAIASIGALLCDFYQTAPRHLRAVSLAYDVILEDDCTVKRPSASAGPGVGWLPSLTPWLDCMSAKRTQAAVKGMKSALPLLNGEPPLVRSGGETLVCEALGATGTALVFGANLHVLWMPYDGKTYEDGVVLARRRGGWEKLIALATQEVDVPFKCGFVADSKRTLGSRGTQAHPLLNTLDDDGVVRVGSEVRMDSVIGLLPSEGYNLRNQMLLAAILGTRTDPKGRGARLILYDRPLGGLVSRVRKQVDGEQGMARVTVEAPLPPMIGDKLTTRYGHKGVITDILPEDSLPTVISLDASPDIILNPLSLPSRSNWGGVIESALGAVAFHLGSPLLCPLLDPSAAWRKLTPLWLSLTWLTLSECALMGIERLAFERGAMHALSMAEGLASSDEEARHEAIVTRLAKRMVQSIGAQTTFGETKAAISSALHLFLKGDALCAPPAETNSALIPLCREYWQVMRTKHRFFLYSSSPERFRFFVRLGDGQITESPAAIGVAYILRLDQLAIKKASAHRGRSVSPSTLQPAGGRRNNGAQRIGEMERWALEQYGAHDLLNALFHHASDPKSRWRDTRLSTTFSAALELLRAIGIETEVSAQTGDK